VRYCIPASLEAVGENCFGLSVSDRFSRDTPLVSVIIESGSMSGKVGLNALKGCDFLPRIETFPDFARIQRSLFCDDEKEFWVGEMKNGRSFLRKVDEY
jgi:hypothetical protein